MRYAGKSFYSFLAPQLTAYMDFRRKLGYTSFAKLDIVRDFDHYLVFRDLGAIDQIDAALIHDWIHVTERAPGTKNNRLKFARGLFRYLERLDLVHTNPALQIPNLKTRYYKPHIYSLKELHQILEEARGFKRRYPRRLIGW